MLYKNVMNGAFVANTRARSSFMATSFAMVVAVAWIVLPVQAYSETHTRVPAARESRPMNGLSAEQMANFTGTYHAVHRTKHYTVIIQPASYQHEHHQFIVAGFFDVHRADFFAGINQFLDPEIEDIQQGICNVIETVFCTQQRKKQSTSFCADQNTLAIASDYYFNAPRKFGMLFSLSASDGKIATDAYFMGDYFENLKGNFLLPEKEYRVSEISLNENQHLSGISFKETGYIQFFTSEKMTFKKYSNDTSPRIQRYIEITDTIQQMIDRNPQSMCNTTQH